MHRVWRCAFIEKVVCATTISIDKSEASTNCTHLSALLTSRWHLFVTTCDAIYDDKYNFYVHNTNHFGQPHSTLMLFIYSHPLFHMRIFAIINALIIACTLLEQSLFSSKSFFTWILLTILYIYDIINDNYNSYLSMFLIFILLYL